MRNATFSRAPGHELKEANKPSERPAGASAETRGSLWYEIADDHSVLEFRTAAANAGSLLELHVVIDSEADTTIAWWETDNGMWVVHVGSA